MLVNESDVVARSFIWVDRAERIRKEITDEAAQEKAESIARVGLLHPLIVRRDGKLVAGETRLAGLDILGWDRIPIRWADTLEENELLAIELEENIKRTDLSWQEQCDALLRLHELRSRTEKDWNQSKTAEAVGLAPQTVSHQLAVAKELRSGNERVRTAKEYSVARGITIRQNERKASDELSLIKATVGPKDDDEVQEAKQEAPIINADFLEWVDAYDGPPFNFIHCDFPYGINADKFNQGAADAYRGYEDSPETYWKLVAALINNREKLLGNSGHILFWFSMRHYSATLAALSEVFWVDPYPLVWVKSDNKGTLPDPQRGPRRIYEVAFLCSHGDRKIIQPVSNTFSAPTVRLGEHMSEKNEDMLKYFMRMIVDDNTRLLDPTCGSGSALRAGAGLGAASVLGLELNPEFAANAIRAWERR